MERALDLAEEAVARGQMPFGAVVVDQQGAVLGEGYNTVLADRDPTAHGEIAAIRDAWRRSGSHEALTGCTLYTSCEPCLSCSYVIVTHGLARVVFAAHGEDVPGYRPLLGGNFVLVAEWVHAQPDWLPIEVVGGVLRERAAAQLRDFPWSEI